MLRLPSFTPFFPTTLLEAIRRKGESAESAFVAGGTDLYPNMKRRQQTPAVVVDVRGVSELTQLGRSAEGWLVMGGGVTLTRLIHNPVVRTEWPVLGKAAATISTPILQNMGTVGGNLLLDTRCNYYNQTYEWRQAIDFCMKKDGDICWVAPSSPRCWAVQSSDLAPVMVALGATVTLAGKEGTRTIPAAALYHNDGMAFLTKAPDELLVSVQVPPLHDARADYQKLRRRGAFDFPVASAATWIRFGDNGQVQDARIVLGAVGSFPVQNAEATAALVGAPLSDESIDAAARAAARPAKPLDNTDFTIGWRKEMVGVLVRRGLGELKNG